MPRTRPHTVIVICGPTASGKTDLAIRAAERFGTAVISADSRQCYREMTIGTAKPGEEELARVHHYFINSHSVAAPVNAGVFEQLALGYASEIFAGRDTAILCGGTGLYVRAFSEGIDQMPSIPEEVRLRVRELYQTLGLEAFRELVRRQDPLFYESGENKNPHRLMRALEVREATGHSILTYRKGIQRPREFRTVKVGLQWPREELTHRIETRVHRMIAAGLVEEVRSLIPFRGTPPLDTVGYPEIFRYLDGEISLDEATEQITTHTRQYAKRQMTWFRKDAGVTWFDGRYPEQVLEYLLRENN
jgi:tRNA dimethylallyltransferase